MKSALHFVLLTAALLSPNSALTAEKDIIEKSFDVQPGGSLVMNVDRGTISVTTSESRKVEVRVTRELKRASASKAREVFDLHRIDLEQAGDTVKISAKNKESFRSRFRNPFNNLNVEYSIAIPSRFRVDLQTSGGDIRIGDLTGEVQARTSGGTITLASVAGNADIRTSGGDLRTGFIQGDLMARTSGGSIRVKRATGSVDAQTSGGNLEIDDANGPVVATTSGGNVSAQLSQQPKSDCKLKTSGGNVSVTLAPNLALDLSAQTSGGSIRSDFDGDLNQSHTKLVAKLNGGGPDLTLETSGGNVTIRRQ